MEVARVPASKFARGSPRQGAFDPHEPTRLFNEAVNLRQAQTGSLTRWLCCKKGSKTRLSRSWLMPTPLSVTSIST